MRVLRFFYLFKLFRIMKVKLPTFYYSYGNDVSVKNIWEHSKGWRFNWE